MQLLAPSSIALIHTTKVLFLAKWNLIVSETNHEEKCCKNANKTGICPFLLEVAPILHRQIHLLYMPCVNIVLGKEVSDSSERKNWSTHDELSFEQALWQNLGYPEDSSSSSNVWQAKNVTPIHPQSCLDPCPNKVKNVNNYQFWLH